MTTLTQPSVVAARPSPPAKTQSARTRSHPKWVPVSIGAGAVLVVVLAGWAIAGWGGGSIGAGPVDRMIVQPRTFNVVLKEKGELKAALSTDIKCEVEGRSTIISLIPEGTAVQKGDLLVELASADIEDRIRQDELKESNAVTEYEAAKTDLDVQREKNASDIRKADLEIQLKTLELRKYEEGDWVQKLKDADIAIEQAAMSLERREQDYSASKELFAKNYTTQTEHEEAEFNFKKAQWDLEKAKMSKSVLEQYTHVADHKQRESNLHEATKEFERVKKNAEAEELRKQRNVEGKGKELALIRDQLAKLRTQKEKCKIYAPTQGFVVYYTGGGGRRWMSDDQQIKEGAEVFERQILMQLPDTTVMNAVVRIHEAKTDKLRSGQQATVTVEGIPGQTFSGKVTKIAVLADSQSAWLNPDLKEYETEITLDATDAVLKPGVTAHAEILVETVEDKLAIPIQSVYAKRGQRYVFKGKGSDAEHVPVRLGSIGAEWAEVVSGLSAGDSVLLAFGEELKRRIPDSGDGPRGPGEAASPDGARRGPGRRPGGPGGGPSRMGGPGGGRPGQPGAAQTTQFVREDKPGAERRVPETQDALGSKPEGSEAAPTVANTTPGESDTKPAPPAAKPEGGTAPAPASSSGTAP